jgi:hypothetical protein
LDLLALLDKVTTAVMVAVLELAVAVALLLTAQTELVPMAVMVEMERRLLLLALLLLVLAVAVAEPITDPKVLAAVVEVVTLLQEQELQILAVEQVAAQIMEQPVLAVQVL